MGFESITHELRPKAEWAFLLKRDSLNYFEKAKVTIEWSILQNANYSTSFWSIGNEPIISYPDR